MQETYLDICGMPTRVITWGKQVGEGFARDEPKDIVLMIPGNPGITRFYCEFLQTIHERLGYPVWIVGHAGQEPSKDSSGKLPEFEGNEKLYGLQGQILFKQAFIEKYVPKDARIHFVGHSLGAYMILQLLKAPSVRKRVVGNYLLFPTIERLEDTLNAKFLRRIVAPITEFIRILLWLFAMLPAMLRIFLLKIILMCFFVPKTPLDAQTVVNLLELDAIKATWLLAKDQMNTVKQRDNDILQENKDKIKLFYGESDWWAPPAYCEELKNDIPGIHAEVSKHMVHGFIVKQSKEMGNIVANWIQN